MTQEKEERELLLKNWYTSLMAAKEAKLVIEKEQVLRKKVSDEFFPEPEEGVNTIELAGGWKLKLTHKIDRKLDEAALPAIQAQLKEMGINFDTVVRYKPDLDTKVYKSMKTHNAEAIKVFDQCLTIKPASPTMELVEPKGK
jgi:hypothetical protein